MCVSVKRKSGTATKKYGRMGTTNPTVIISHCGHKTMTFCNKVRSLFIDAVILSGILCNAWHPNSTLIFVHNLWIFWCGNWKILGKLK